MLVSEPSLSGTMSFPPLGEAVDGDIGSTVSLLLVVSKQEALSPLQGLSPALVPGMQGTDWG